VKLARFGPIGAERPGIVVSSELLFDVSSLVRDFDHDFFAGGGPKWLAAEAARHSVDLPPILLDGSVRLGSPIARPGKVVCIGLNYADHAAESGMPVPEEPVVFMKASSTVVGPFDDVYIPRGSLKTDWEVELGIVIGSEARYLEDNDAAAAAIAGYCVSHDVSERHFQLERGGQWDKGKSCERFNPVGPWLVTTDELTDPRSLTLRLDVNGERKQRGTTSTMVFDVFEIVHYLSQFMVLEPGDLINTGTPPGVGMGQKPPHYLAPGDVVDLEIEGLGAQRQRFVAAP